MPFFFPFRFIQRSILIIGGDKINNAARSFIQEKGLSFHNDKDFFFLISSNSHSSLFLKMTLLFSLRLQSLMSALKSRPLFHTYASLPCIPPSVPSVLTTTCYWPVCVYMSPAHPPFSHFPFLLSTLSLEMYLFFYTVGPPYPQIENFWSKNIPESFQKQNLNVPCLGNSSHSICISLTTIYKAFTLCLVS